jgi:hypothetical protein
LNGSPYSEVVGIGVLAVDLWLLLSLKGRSLEGPCRVAAEKATVAFLSGIWYPLSTYPKKSFHLLDGLLQWYRSQKRLWFGSIGHMRLGDVSCCCMRWLDERT